MKLTVSIKTMLQIKNIYVQFKFSSDFKYYKLIQLNFIGDYSLSIYVPRHRACDVGDRKGLSLDNMIGLID